jgi:hypothetical protein
MFILLLEIFQVTFKKLMYKRFKYPMISLNHIQRLPQMLVFNNCSLVLSCGHIQAFLKASIQIRNISTNTYLLSTLAFPSSVPHNNSHRILSHVETNLIAASKTLLPFLSFSIQFEVQISPLGEPTLLLSGEPCPP